jgi:hypothetical protein
VNYFDRKIPVNQEALALACDQDVTRADVTMKDISVEIGMLMCWGSEKLVLRPESANDVLPVMASAIALTNSREDLNKGKSRATTSRDILYWLRGTISLNQHAHFSFLSKWVRVM